VALAALVAPACARGPAPTPTPSLAGPSPRWCDLLPRPANAALPRVRVASDWFEVYQAADGVYALAEPLQFEETISYLILGRERALLFDSGLGLVPIRPVVEELTRLPVDVLNSHTHFDHVGGNAEFDTVLAMDTPYTKANARGFPHAALAGEVAPASFCKGAPRGADVAAFHTRAWKATRRVTDGDTLDLGGRILEVLHVPGHTPDALALLDRAAGLLWTGDSYYEGPLWLFVPETSLDDYERSLARLAALAPEVKRLLPAHNTAAADPGGLVKLQDVIRRIRAGSVAGTSDPEGRLTFEVDGISVLTSGRVLQGKAGDAAKGGSGLTTGS
jgi:glyoxylase-like metal-dependent hydrolase (beta-lactamase superfamily II)